MRSVARIVGTANNNRDDEEEPEGESRSCAFCGKSEPLPARPAVSLRLRSRAVRLDIRKNALTDIAPTRK